jgi:hypothetical protein
MPAGDQRQPATAGDPFHTIFYQLLDGNGNPVPGATNDQYPPTGTLLSPPATNPGGEVVFGTVASGFSVGTSQIQITDARVCGGGLAPQYQSIPQADMFWDLGHLDGKPYPLGGTSVVFLPASILNTFADADVQAIVAGLMPMGTLAVVR